MWTKVSFHEAWNVNQPSHACSENKTKRRASARNEMRAYFLTCKLSGLGSYQYKCSKAAAVRKKAHKASKLNISKN